MKVVGDLSARERGICPFRENDKMRSSQKGGFEKGHLKALGRED